MWIHKAVVCTSDEMQNLRGAVFWVDLIILLFILFSSPDGSYLRPNRSLCIKPGSGSNINDSLGRILDA